MKQAYSFTTDDPAEMCLVAAAVLVALNRQDIGPPREMIDEVERDSIPDLVQRLGPGRLEKLGLMFAEIAQQAMLEMIEADDA